MFSAFSFGKIIKTILPGAILTLGLLFLAEGLWGWWRPSEGFLLGKVPKDWITPFTAGLIPVSLILGFFLNTFSWMTLNSRARARCDGEIKATVYGLLREKLSEELSADLAAHFAKGGKHHAMKPFPKPPSLEYYYLPVVTLTNLNYLWESYFCWYEFDINSAAAFLVSVPAALFLLFIKFWEAPFTLVALALVLLALSCALYKMLTIAAVKNLVSYEKNLMLLISGALECAAKNAAAKA